MTSVDYPGEGQRHSRNDVGLAASGLDLLHGLVEDLLAAARDEDLGAVLRVRLGDGCVVSSPLFALPSLVADLLPTRTHPCQDQCRRR